MSPANDNSASGRDLALPLDTLGVSGGAAAGALRQAQGERHFDIVAGGCDHAAIVTLRAAPSSSGKLRPVTGSNLRPAPAEINAVAGALAAMIAELPVRGGILDRLS